MFSADEGARQLSVMEEESIVVWKAMLSRQMYKLFLKH